MITLDLLKKLVNDFRGGDASAVLRDVGTISNGLADLLDAFKGGAPLFGSAAPFGKAELESVLADLNDAIAGPVVMAGAQSLDWGKVLQLVEKVRDLLAAIKDLV